MSTNSEQIQLSRYFNRRMLPLAIGIGLLITVFFPATYYFIEYNNMKHTASFYASRFSKAVNELVLSSEPLWKYQTYEYRKILDGLLLEKEINLQVFDENGQHIQDYEHKSIEGTSWWIVPVPSASVPIRFNNRLIGSVTVSLSQDKLVARTSIIFVISLLVGSLLAALTYFFPVEIVSTMSTEIEKLIANLAAEKEQLAVTLRSIGDGVITTDTNGKIILLNTVAERLTGWKHEQAVGLTLQEVFHIIDEQTRRPIDNPVERVIRTGSIVQLSEDTILIAKDGAEKFIEDSAAPICNSQSKIIGVVLAFRDMTEKRKMSRDLLRTEQLESLGVLAGGIAHDFNNLLTGILGNVSMAKLYTDPESKAFAKLQAAEKAYDRARDLTQSLLTFSKGGAPNKKTISIDQLIMHSASFTLAGSNVRCQYFFPESVWPVDVDEGQMSQVINNLIINADQAMPNGGVINITLENITSNKDWDKPNGKKYVKITIEDEGTGISESNLSKIFDPYFTTKESGNGLGLATAHSIIRHHEGHITVTSKPGVGTSFCISLPASNSENIQRTRPRSSVAGGNEKVLIMDDEEIIRQVASEILTHIGYRVTVCCDGKEALDLYSQATEEGDPFDAVIMDLTIPGGMGGSETIQRLIKIDPDVKAIVSSGYSNDHIISNYADCGFSGFVVKPYKIAELSETLKSVLHPPQQQQ